MLTKNQIISALKKVLDPELQISVYDLGLIYDITVGKKGNVKILMTLTSIGCPLFTTIQSEMEEAVKKIKGVTGVEIELTFDPPWNMDKISIEGKEKLGLF
jgi:metal-sulfur cluster biosynthetic enzyme